MRFYDYSLAPSPRKVRLFIAEKGLSIPTVEVDLRARAQLDAGVSRQEPRRDGARSRARRRHVPDREPRDLPLPGASPPGAEPVRRRREGASARLDVDRHPDVRGLPRSAGGVAQRAPGVQGRGVGRPRRYEQIPALAERGKRRAEVYFNKLETRLGESEFIAGERYTYADIVGYVYLGFAGRALGGATPLEGRPALQAVARQNSCAARDSALGLVAAPLPERRHGTISGSPSWRAMNGSTR